MNTLEFIDLRANQNEAAFPALPGSYALHLRLLATSRLQVGRLGTFDLPAGEYLYTGSAHGPGGLRGRLAHHMRIAAKPHWHLDWLRPYVEMVGVWIAMDETPVSLECSWAQQLAQLSGASIPAPGFGSADCRLGCQAHLICVPSFVGWVEGSRNQLA